MAKEKKIILFDGVCNLCNRSVQFILKQDKKEQFLFGSLQGIAGQEFLKKFNLSPDHFHSFMLVEGEKLYTRSEAALRVLRHIGNGWNLFYVFILIPPFIRDGIYHWIAKNRYQWFGRSTECWIPSPEWQSKFLD